MCFVVVTFCKLYIVLLSLKLLVLSSCIFIQKAIRMSIRRTFLLILTARWFYSLKLYVKLIYNKLVLHVLNNGVFEYECVDKP